jgi:ABC-2 type transport system ATP-binding protein
VRLAFAVMVEADADIMLVDEVLAVGDASFAQKCLDVFHEKRRSGRTLVLVTHDMASVEELCDRAMLLHEGELAHVGDPAETASRYFHANFDESADPSMPAASGGVWDVNVDVVDAHLEGEAGARVRNVEQGTPLRLRIVLRARRELQAPVVGLHVVDALGSTVFGFNRSLAAPGGGEALVPEGGTFVVHGSVENPLQPGRYFLHCYVARNRQQGDYALHRLRLLDFVVYGTQAGPGTVNVPADVQVELQRDVAPVRRGAS